MHGSVGIGEDSSIDDELPDPGPLTLGGAFPPATAEQWRIEVDRVLAKGLSDPTTDDLTQAFERQLVTSTYDGFSTEPLYGPADVPELDTGWPGASPFVRGSTAAVGTQGGWDVCQPLVVDPADTAATSVRALEELERGATSLLLRTVDGSALEVDGLEASLDGVHVELVGLIAQSGADGSAEALLDLWDRRGTGDQAKGCLALDPIGARAADAATDVHARLAHAVEMASRCAADRPNVRAIVVDSTRYAEAGGSDVEELGCSIATVVAYVRVLVDGGMDPADALAQIELRLAAGTDQFLTIAKLRASRLLWSRVVAHLGWADVAPPPRQHAVMSGAVITHYDPWVNLLRGTIACMAAGVGGADAVTIEAYDSRHGPIPSALGRRMARNTQAVLIEESRLAHVMDPGGGSYYVEWLTDTVAREAWEWFRSIEAAGGMVDALEAGIVAERIGATWQKREQAIARRKDPITGISEFPNIDEVVPPPAVDEVEPRAPEATELPRRRFAAAFEDMRARSDDHLRRHGHRPVVLLANLGSAADSTARTTFAKNWFEAGGLATVAWERDTTDLADVLAGLPGGVPPLACLCSSDRVYATDAAAALAELRAAGVGTVYLAGRHDVEPPEGPVDGHISAGADALAFLAGALEIAGVAHLHEVTA